MIIHIHDLFVNLRIQKKKNGIKSRNRRITQRGKINSF